MLVGLIDTAEHGHRSEMKEPDTGVERYSEGGGNQNIGEIPIPAVPHFPPVVRQTSEALAEVQVLDPLAVRDPDQIIPPPGVLLEGRFSHQAVDSAYLRPRGTAKTINKISLGFRIFQV